MHPHEMFLHDRPMHVAASQPRPPGSRGGQTSELHFSFDFLGHSLVPEEAGEDVEEGESGEQGKDEEEDGSTPPER